VFDLAEAQVRMAMTGLLIVGNINTPSVQHTVEYIPTFASGAGSGGLIGTEGDCNLGEQRAHCRSRPRKRINAFPSSLRP
jgi:hypothetical protein